MDWESTGGGGFLNETLPDEPHQVTSTVSVGAGEEKQDKKLVAVSVSQVCKLTCSGFEHMKLHGKKVGQIHLVAFIYEILDISSQKVHVLVDDYTGGGPLEVSHVRRDAGMPDSDDAAMSMFNHENGTNGMSNGNSEQKKLTDLRQGDYVSIIGGIKWSSDKANVVAYDVRYVEDPNEITMHTLEVIRDSLSYERMDLPSNDFKQGGEETNRAGGYQQEQSKNEFGKLTLRDKHLLKFLKEKAGENGMKTADIEDNFKAFSRSDIQSSLNTLCQEGLAWQGDQEDIWCVASDL